LFFGGYSYRRLKLPPHNQLSPCPEEAFRDWLTGLTGGWGEIPGLCHFQGRKKSYEIHFAEKGVGIERLSSVSGQPQLNALQN
jgi:hypothetical protein